MKCLYVRVSTEEQNEARQTALKEQMSIDKVFIDKASGKNTDRKALREMLDFVREDDIVIVESISRLARSTKDLLNIVELLEKKKVAFVSLKENIDTQTPQGRFMITVFGAMAELEREQILQRQREGIAIAKEQKKYKGRARVEIDESEFNKVCKAWMSGEITARDAQRKLKLSANTFYRRAKEKGYKRADAE